MEILVEASVIIIIVDLSAAAAATCFICSLSPRKRITSEPRIITLLTVSVVYDRNEFNAVSSVHCVTHRRQVFYD